NTPPGSWYTDPEFYQLEVARVFEKSWLPIGRIDQLAKPGDYITADIADNPIVVVRGDDGQPYGHHNVCRHKGAMLAEVEDDSRHRCAFFQCPYHGWEYQLDGRLRKAPMLGPQKNFDVSQYGLVPVSVDTWGPFVFVDLDGPIGGEGNPRVLHDDLAPIKGPLEDLGFEHLKFYKRFVYDMQCNWKVFADNSLDGGYHVKYAHEGLASGLDMEDFETHIFPRSSIQICNTTGDDARLGAKVMYAYLYPNFFINRYGNMMDTNIVMPVDVDRCRVIFDFYFDYDDMEAWESRRKIRQSVASSHSIQQEDIDICESAQRGMQSLAWRHGRYSSTLERAVHAFHVLLWHELSAGDDA
ncbi:MAG: aromatic ring-hydroxylating dioxygenase subunit alpha, partial [Planctomycetales bacterium]|nr:aromatic ring-hydroxylating dioxygenase subunit alpha [Planctomycetales bacterium]